MDKNNRCTGKSLEIRNRIRIALAALAYEKYDDPIMDDASFDALAREIDLSVETGRPDLDKWFRENFNPSTGSWVWKHPELEKLEKLLLRVYYGE